MAFKRRINPLEGRGMIKEEYLYSSCKILNPKHQILNKFQYLNSKFKTNISLKKKAFLIFEFWYLVLFRISDLELRISHLNKEG